MTVVGDVPGGHTLEQRITGCRLGVLGPRQRRSRAGEVDDVRVHGESARKDAIPEAVEQQRPRCGTVDRAQLVHRVQDGGCVALGTSVQRERRLDDLGPHPMIGVGQTRCRLLQQRFRPGDCTRGEVLLGGSEEQRSSSWRVGGELGGADEERAGGGAPSPGSRARRSRLELGRDRLVLADHRRRPMPGATVSVPSARDHRRQRGVHAAAVLGCRTLVDGRADQRMSEGQVRRQQLRGVRRCRIVQAEPELDSDALHEDLVGTAVGRQRQQEQPCRPRLRPDLAKEPFLQTRPERQGVEEVRRSGERLHVDRAGELGERKRVAFRLVDDPGAHAGVEPASGRSEDLVGILCW